MKQRYLYVLTVAVVVIFSSIIMAAPVKAAPETTSRGVDSGFVDDQGNPISEADYDKMVAKEKMNIIQRYPAISAGVVVVIIAGVTALVVKRSRKSL